MAASLTVSSLTITYPGPPAVRAVDDVSLIVAPGECLGILGESGSGKSTLARALLGLTDARVDGAMALGDESLTGLDENTWRRFRWKRVAMCFQSTASLNPVLRVGEQLAEPVRVHMDMSEREAEVVARDLLDRVGLGDWALRRYPSELSGGQKRLVLLAMSLACRPEVLLLDEPTAGLDAVTRARVLDLVADIRDKGDTAMVMLGHDVEALETVATHVSVMYRGWVAESGPAEAVLDRPRSPYARALLNARPTLRSLKEMRGIRGEAPNPTEVAAGCPFLGRCTQAVTECESGRPPEVSPPGEADGSRVVACVRGGVVAVVVARNLSKAYELRSGLVHRERIVALDGVDLDLMEGEVLGLVGSTGAGKSTLGMALLRVLEPDSGTVSLEGVDLLGATGSVLKALRRRAQMLFQDPYEALSPRLTVGPAVREPLDAQGIGSRSDRESSVRSVLAATRLPTDEAFLGRHTHELSGGQLQRVALARALVLEPKLLVADEPVSMLDPSEQVKMLQLLKTLQVERGMAMVFVSHDIAVVLRVADRVMVMDGGRVVEQGPGTALLVAPQHPVTQALLAAASATTRDPRRTHPLTWSPLQPLW